MLSPATLGRRYLDESISAQGGARLRILERPGRWMREDDLARVVADVRTVARACLPAGQLAYGAASGDRERLDASVLTIVYSREGKPVAFNALALLECELRGAPVEVLHLGLVMIDPGYRASGLSATLYGLTCFLLFARRQLRPLWVSNVTQVPSIFGMVAEQFDRVYPTSDPRDRQRFDHLHLARQIAARHRHVFGVGPEAVFDERRGVFMNAYTGGSDDLKKRWEDAPKHRHDAHNETCRRELDYDRGDDFLQLGQFDLRVARRYFVRSTRLLSPLALAAQFAFGLLESVVAPVLQWFSAERAMGDLRPAHGARR